MSPARARHSAWRTIRGTFATLLLAAGLLAAGEAGAADSVQIVLDRATVVKLPERIATVIVGNPLIADVSLQPGGIMVLTGKGYGVTNVLALDRSGTVLVEKSVHVSGPRDDVLIVHRGIARESYSCNPDCERRLMLGDAQQPFESALTQTDVRARKAQDIGK